MTRISDAEREAIRAMLADAAVYGFGNFISHLSTAWTRRLMRVEGFPEEVARRAAGGDRGYPVKMQEDLLERGEWDETGRRYAPEAVVDAERVVDEIRSERRAAERERREDQE